MSNISPKQLKKTPSDVSTVESHKLKSKEWKERLRSLSKPRHLYSDDSGDEIGPGQYETNDLVLSTVHRSPQVKLYKSSSKSKTNQNETPSSLSYFPNFEAVHTSNPISIFPKADVRRLKFLDELGKRSPGPKYSWNLSVSPGAKFSHVSYSPDKTRHLSVEEKNYLKNNIRYPSTGKITQDNTSRNSQSPIKTPLIQRSATRGNLVENPIASSNTNRFKYSFSKEKRELSWKKLKGFKDNIRFYKNKLTKQF